MKARVAPTTFPKEVVAWWKCYIALTEEVELTWEEFKEIFLRKYFLETKQKEMKDKFNRLE